MQMFCSRNISDCYQYWKQLYCFKFWWKIRYITIKSVEYYLFLYKLILLFNKVALNWLSKALKWQYIYLYLLQITYISNKSFILLFIHQIIMKKFKYHSFHKKIWSENSFQCHFSAWDFKCTQTALAPQMSNYDQSALLGGAKHILRGAGAPPRAPPLALSRHPPESEPIQDFWGPYAKLCHLSGYEWMKRICPCFTPSRIRLTESVWETVSLPRLAML